MRCKNAYNQIIEFENEFPKDLKNFSQISCLLPTYYNVKATKTDNTESFKKRIVRYSFTVQQKSNTVSALPVRVYIYDNKQDAEKAYKYCMRTWIDEQIEPYRKLVRAGKKLTLEQMDKCEEIQGLLVED